ncbi:MFS transporter [Fusibacter ferrireducens]|uniref:MFS transporter n=1 Tax=Fusibacter ferrireducens TaxID=2785058 RepID=A0ABR9ZRX8_9FIRM|nr:MFS transporter [Fusibacter ferrireducens]MBF4693220.1 MFS transporter [Fusibacter ferrireducens]
MWRKQGNGYKLSSLAEHNIHKYILYSVFSNLLILGPILTIFFLAKGLNFTQIFTIGAVNSLFVVLFEVPTGAVADKYSRKLSIIIGCIMWIISLFIYIYAQNFATFIIAEIIFSIGMTFKSGAEMAILYDSLKLEDREHEFQTIVGKGRSYFLYASAIGSLVAGFVYSYNIYLPFMISIGFIFISLVIAILFKEPKLHEFKVHSEIKYTQVIKNSAGLILNNRKVLNVVLFSTVTFIFMRMAYSFYQPHMQASGVDVKYFGLIFFAFNIVAGFSAKRIDFFIKKTKPYSMLSVGGLVAISYLLLGLFPVLISFSFIFLQQITRGLGNPVFSKYINKNIPSEYRATVISFNSLIGNVGVIILQPLFGYLIDKYSVFLVEMGIGVLMIICLGLIEIFVKRNQMKQG